MSTPSASPEQPLIAILVRQIQPIREFADRYEAFLSGVQLTQQIISLVEANPSAALYVGSALLGASIGTAIVRKSEGALIGAGVGLLIAGILQAVNANGRPPAED